MASGSLTGFVIGKFQSAAVKHLTQLLYPSIRRQCAKVTGREVIMCERDAAAMEYRLFYEKIAPEYSDKFALELSKLVARGVVISVPTVSYAYWSKLCKSSKEVYKQTRDLVNNEENSEENDTHNAAAAGGGGGGSENQGEANTNGDIQYHVDLAILTSISNNDRSTEDAFLEKHFGYVQGIFPHLKFSKGDIAERIKSLKKSFNDVKNEHGNDPQMDHCIERIIFEFSKMIWGVQDGE